MTETNPRPRPFLRTFGAPDLVGVPDELKVRAKDLALLAWLRLQPPMVHRRTMLASLLWAENRERDARHSLTQAVVRLRKVLGEDAILTTRETVVWAGELDCDAAMLEGAARDDAPSLLEFYEGEFLAGLALGPGTQSFDDWASKRRVDYREMAADLADRWGAAAEARGDWPAAHQLALRAVTIDPYLESSHRRIMRALVASGDRNRALQHYLDYAAKVQRDMGLAPQNETTRLADEIREDVASPPSADPGPDAGGAALPAASEPAPPRDLASDPRDLPAAHAQGDDAAPARLKWVAAGVVAASVLLAVVLTRPGVRAS